MTHAENSDVNDIISNISKFEHDDLFPIALVFEFWVNKILQLEQQEQHGQNKSVFCVFTLLENFLDSTKKFILKYTNMKDERNIKQLNQFKS